MQGIQLWGSTQKMTIRGQEYTVVYMDTEGHGAPGNPVDSYDPKVFTLTIILSSFFIYNVNHEIDMRDINMLHNVVSLSQLFEARLMQRFPFPPMMWVVQQFEGELGNHTPEQLLDYVLQEKENAEDSEEKRKYNETIRAVRQFPNIGEPRIMLMDRPHRMARMSQLPHIEFKDLEKSYVGQISMLKRTILDRLHVKKFSNMPPNGRFLANVVKQLVYQMNEIDTADVGPALIKELALELKHRCFEYYEDQLVILGLPQDVHVLLEVHNVSKTEALNMFVRNCTGGLESFDNAKYHAELRSSIDFMFDRHIRNNTAIAHMTLAELVKSVFQPVAEPHAEFESIGQFDRLVEELKLEFEVKAKGPQEIKVKILTDYITGELGAKRELVVKKNAHKDFKEMATVLGAICVFCTVFSYFVTPWNAAVSNYLHGISTLSLIMLLVTFSSFHEALEMHNIVQFDSLQNFYGTAKGLLLHVQPVYSFFFGLLYRYRIALLPMTVLCIVCQQLMKYGGKLRHTIRQRRKSDTLAKREKENVRKMAQVKGMKRLMERTHGMGLKTPRHQRTLSGRRRWSVHDTVFQSQPADIYFGDDETLWTPNEPSRHHDFR